MMLVKLVCCMRDPILVEVPNSTNSTGDDRKSRQRATGAVRKEFWRT